MAVQFYFDNLEAITFQRLINALLNARFGDVIRLLPLRVKDGGRDAETLPFPGQYQLDLESPPLLGLNNRLGAGRYVFQVKHHRMSDREGSVVRGSVVSDFENELKTKVLDRKSDERVNYFFLITNVSSSKEAVAKVDEKRKELLKDRQDLYADVLWQEHVVSWLDQFPRVWHSYPELFPGMVVPGLGQVADSRAQGLSQAVRIAVDAQSRRDGVVRFRQINFEQRLSRLFVDLDAHAPMIRRVAYQIAIESGRQEHNTSEAWFWASNDMDRGISCIGMLVSEAAGAPRRVILEGGPGQGKSTVTQMLAQLYRAAILQKEAEYREVWANIPRARFPFRIELRLFAEWLGSTDGTVEEYLSQVFTRDAGGSRITVEALHSIVEDQPVLLIFDGLDEVGSDALRDSVISKISECTDRFEGGLKADLRVVLTSRPPAIAGRVSKLSGFNRVQILPLSDQKVDDYVRRWTDVQCVEESERDRVRESFNRRKPEQHVRALVKNPMQLSVLLHFIRLKGEAFPDRR